MPLKPGDEVTIYQDPFTRTMPEGKALLIAKEGAYATSIERWQVRFPGDPNLYSRTILLKEELNENHPI